MKERFISVFGYEVDSMLRIWGEEYDVCVIIWDVWVFFLKFFLVLVVVRLDDGMLKDDVIEIFFKLLLGDVLEIGF